MKPVLAATLATAAVLAASAAARGSAGSGPVGSASGARPRRAAGAGIRAAEPRRDLPALPAEPWTACRCSGPSWSSPTRPGAAATWSWTARGEWRRPCPLLSRRGRCGSRGAGRACEPPRAATRRRSRSSRAGRGPALVWRVLLASAAPLASLEVLVDARSGAVVRTRDLLQYANGTAQLYDPNPVVANGGTAGLSDADDADSALLTSLRLPRTLPRLDASTCLRGSFVEAILPPGDPDADTPAGDVCSPTRDFDAVTRSQQPVRGADGVLPHRPRAGLRAGAGLPERPQPPIRANVDAPIPGPPTEDGQDNSFFDLLTGRADLRHRLRRRRRGRRDDRARVRARDPGGQVPGFPRGLRRRGDRGGLRGLLRVGAVGHLRPARGLRGLLRRVGRVRVGSRQLPAAGGPGAAARQIRRRIAHRPTTSTAGARSGPARSGRSARRSGRHGRRQARDPVALQPDPAASFDQAARALLAADSALYRGRAPGAAEGGARRARARGRRAPRRHAGGREPARAARARERPALAVGRRRARRLRAQADRAPPGGAPAAVPGAATTTCACWRPGAAASDAPPAAVAEGPTGNEEIHHVPAVSGTYFLDVRAIAGSGSYTLEAASDDLDGDGVADCERRVPALVRSAPARLGSRSPRRSLRPQRARDPDRREAHGPSDCSFAPACGRPRCRPRPSASSVWKRVCKRGRCRYRPGSHAGARAGSRDGRVELRFRLPPRPLPPPGRAARRPATSAPGAARAGSSSVARRAAGPTGYLGRMEAELQRGGPSRFTPRSPRAGAIRCARSTSAPWSWRPATRSCAPRCSASWT